MECKRIQLFAKNRLKLSIILLYKYFNFTQVHMDFSEHLISRLTTVSTCYVKRFLGSSVFRLFYDITRQV